MNRQFSDLPAGGISNFDDSFVEGDDEQLAGALLVVDFIGDNPRGVDSYEAVLKVHQLSNRSLDMTKLIDRRTKKPGFDRLTDVRLLVQFKRYTAIHEKLFMLQNYCTMFGHRIIFSLPGDHPSRKSSTAYIESIGHVPKTKIPYPAPNYMMELPCDPIYRPPHSNLHQTPIRPQFTRHVVPVHTVQPQRGAPVVHGGLRGQPFHQSGDHVGGDVPLNQRLVVDDHGEIAVVKHSQTFNPTNPLSRNWAEDPRLNIRRDLHNSNLLSPAMRLTDCYKNIHALANTLQIHVQASMQQSALIDDYIENLEQFTGEVNVNFADLHIKLGSVVSNLSAAKFSQTRRTKRRSVRGVYGRDERSDSDEQPRCQRKVSRTLSYSRSSSISSLDKESPVASVGNLSEDNRFTSPSE